MLVLPILQATPLMSSPLEVVLMQGEGHLSPLHCFHVFRVPIIHETYLYVYLSAVDFPQLGRKPLGVRNLACLVTVMASPLRTVADF